MDKIAQNIERLEGMVEKLAKRKKTRVRTLEGKYDKAFERQAAFKGNGIYTIANLFSTDTRELKLMFVLQQEGIDPNKEDKQDVNEDE